MTLWKDKIIDLIKNIGKKLRDSANFENST